MKIIRVGIGLGLVALLATSALGAGEASAQIYPQPDGYCVLSLSDPLPGLSEDVTITVIAADRAGNPLEGLTGELLVTRQPGDSASVTPASFVTGPDGKDTVTLFTGDTPGIIEVSGPCDQVQVNATVSVGDPPGPPSTGDATEGGMLGPQTRVQLLGGLFGAIGAAAVIGGGGIAGVLRRRSSMTDRR